MCNCKTCACGSTSVNVGQKGDKGDTGATGAIGPQGPGGGVVPMINANGTTTTLTSDQFGGTVMLNRALGNTTTLPSAPSDGANFDFVVAITAAGGNYVINVGTDGLSAYQGYLYAKKVTTADEIFSTSGGTIITLNGSTKGGLIGTRFNVTYSSALSRWMVTGNNLCTGAIATPFS